VLKRFQKCLSKDDTIILVDNTELLTKKKSANLFQVSGIIVKYIQNKKNLGLGAALNIGLAQQKYHRDVIFLFDQDSNPTKKLLKEMIRILCSLELKNKRVLLGPLHIEKKSDFQNIKIKKTNKVSVLPTSGMCFLRKNLRSYMVFSKKYFLDYCDFKFCMILRKKKWNIFKTEKTFLKHRLGLKTIYLLRNSVSIPAPFRHYFMARDMLYILFDKDFPAFIKISLFSKNLLRILVPITRDHFTRCMYAFQGAKDFFRNVSGPGILKRD